MQSLVIKVADLTLDTVTREVSVGSVQPRLTATELALLEILMQRSPAVVSRRSIALAVWNEEADALGSNTLDVHLARLRAKICHQRCQDRSGQGARLPDRAGMNVPPTVAPSPYVAHAARVAVVATVIIGAMYVCVVASFDVVDRHRLVAQIDTRLDQRLAQAARQPAAAGSIDDYDNAHDVDDAPVFLWRVTSGRSFDRAHSGCTGSRLDLPGRRSNQSVEARLGAENFRLQSERVGDDWFVVGQSLANVDRVESDLIALEVIAGPVLLLACSSGPCSSASRRPARSSWPVGASSSSPPTPPTSSARRSASSRPRSVWPSTAREVATTTETRSRRVESGEPAPARHRRRPALALPVRLEPPPPGDEPVDVGGDRRGVCRPLLTPWPNAEALPSRCADEGRGPAVDQRPARVDRPSDRGPGGQRLPLRRRQEATCGSR